VDFVAGIELRGGYFGSLHHHWADIDGTNFGFFFGFVGRRPALQAFHSRQKSVKLVRKDRLKVDSDSVGVDGVFRWF